MYEPTKRLLKGFRLSIFGIFIALIGILTCTKYHNIRLNDIQVIGSHNSYKKAIEKPLWDYLYKKDSNKARSLQYEHISITEQLNLGLRSLEIDVFHDPRGGHFTNPQGLEIVRELNYKPAKFDSDNKLSQPGLKVFHIQDIDFRSHQLLFIDCLEEINRWSKNNPGHTPIFILINAKDKAVEGTIAPLEFTANALDSIDLEIGKVFDHNQLITPYLIQGYFKSLEEAVLNNGWPLLDDVKGKLMFVLDEKPEKTNRYLNESTKGNLNVMFVNVPEGDPNAAFRIINDPVKNQDYITELVNKGYMVRTRADAGTKEARTNDYNKFKMAKRSRAQIISTDYYQPTNLFSSEYVVQFDNHKFERILLND